MIADNYLVKEWRQSIVAFLLQESNTIFKSFELQYLFLLLPLKIYIFIMSIKMATCEPTL